MELLYNSELGADSGAEWMTERAGYTYNTALLCWLKRELIEALVGIFSEKQDMVDDLKKWGGARISMHCSALVVAWPKEFAH